MNTITYYSIVIFSSFLSVNAFAQTDYNSCGHLSYSDRNDCLLDMSRKEAILTNDPQVFHNSELGLDIYYAMFLEGTDYFKAGQEFSTTLHPYWYWDWTPKSQLQTDFYVNKFNGTGNGDSGSVGWGRPGIAYKYRWIASEEIHADARLRIRLPFYDIKYKDFDVDPYNRRDIWEVSLENSWKFETRGGHWNLSEGAKYNTDKSYDIACGDPGTCGIISGRIDQHPVVAYLVAGYLWKGDWDLGLSIRTEQTIIKGRTQYLGTGDELREFVSVASNSLSFSAENKLTDKTHLKFLMVKSMIEKYYDQDYIDQNFENSIYGSNLAVGISLWIDL